MLTTTLDIQMDKVLSNMSFQNHLNQTMNNIHYGINNLNDYQKISNPLYEPVHVGTDLFYKQQINENLSNNYFSLPPLNLPTIEHWKFPKSNDLLW